MAMKKKRLNQVQRAVLAGERAFGGSAENVISIRLMLSDFTAQRVKEAADAVLRGADIFSASLDMEAETGGDGMSFCPGGRKTAECRILHVMPCVEAVRYAEEKDRKPLKIPDRLYEAEIIPLQEGGAMLCVHFHHIIIDGYGMSLFAQRVLDVLAGKEAPNSVFFKEDSEEAADSPEDGRFWTEYFQGAEYEPAVFPDSPVGMGMTRVRYAIDRESKQSLDRFAEENGVTVPYVLAAAYAVWLTEAVGKPDAVFLMPRLNRGVEEMQTLGCYTMLVPVRVTVGQEDAFADVCRHVQEAARAASMHKAYGYEHILQELREEGLLSESLSEYVFNYYRYEIRSDLDYSLDISVAGAMHNHFTWSIFREDGGLSFVFDLRDGVCDADRAEYFMDSISGILADGMKGARVSELQVIGEKERARLLGIQGAEIAVDGQATIPSLFRKAAETWKDRPALYAGDVEYTFGELDQASDTIVGRLMEQGVRAGDCVAFMLKRDFRLIPVMLGIAKTGAAFIPVDPMYPKERIDYILEDSGAGYLVSASDVEAAQGREYLSADSLLQSSGKTFCPPKIRQDDLAYIIYTSGTTGKPKGVMLSHKGIANIVHPENNPFNRDAAANGKGIVAIGSICFDISLFEIFVMLFNGLFVELGNEKAMLDAEELARHILRHGADILHCTPSRLASYLKNPVFAKAASGIKMALSAGELLPESLVGELKSQYGIRIYNGYGPTEATIGATITEEGDSKTIGAPIANTGILILNRNGKQTPYGAVGEICIYGNGVGLGYKGREAETQEKFTYFDGKRIYHTGDLGHFAPDGRIFYHGRNDRQIKLRGLRIELAEIEKAMGAYDGVALASCIVKKIEKTEHLVGFFTADPDCVADEGQLRAFLKERLAPYMVPDVLKRLDEMPQTPGGKMDLKALEAISVDYATIYRAPENASEEAVCDAFAAVLSLEQVGADDNFFEIGGSSLNAMELVMEIEKRFPGAEGTELGYADIFKYPTPALLAEYLEGREKETAECLIDGLDHTGIAECLADSDSAEGKRNLGNMLLTGATGYLGAHILIDLLKRPEDSGKIFCLVRPNDRLTALRRMKSALFYYAEEDFMESYGEKWTVVEGDITGSPIFKDAFTERIDTVINSAANVAHFAYGDGLERVNAKGVENLAEYALSTGAMFCQVSTISVGGLRDASVSAESAVFTEDDLYIGQKIFNRYIYSKYLAEHSLLRAAVDRGLAVRIMRVGNLQGRIRDGEFQMNLKTNAFTRQLSSYIKIGSVPESVYHASVNFAPVDETARMIHVLAGTGGAARAFHVYPPDEVPYAGLFTAIGKLGHEVKVVPDEEFESLLQSLKQSEEGRAKVQGLLMERPDGRYREIPVTQEKTKRALELAGESWEPATEAYLGRYLQVLEGMDMF